MKILAIIPVLFLMNFGTAYAAITTKDTYTSSREGRYHPPGGTHPHNPGEDIDIEKELLLKVGSDPLN